MMMPIVKPFQKQIKSKEIYQKLTGKKSVHLEDFPVENTDLINEMCDSIIQNKSTGLYDGAYKVVELAMGLKNK